MAKKITTADVFDVGTLEFIGATKEKIDNVTRCSKIANKAFIELQIAMDELNEQSKS